MKPKVLVISHNCFSSYQNMGKTLKGLFGSFDKEQLSQLYFHSSYPDVDICESTYRITDIEILKATFCLRKKVGSCIDKSNIRPNNKLFDNKQAIFFHQAKKQNRYLAIARDILWGLNKWDTIKLRQWIDLVNPDVIFFAAGDAIFAYNIALTISKRKNIPIVVYFCDNYYSLEDGTMSVMNHLHHKFLNKTIKKVVLSAKSLVYICKNMDEEYRKLFGRSGMVIMTPFQNQIDSLKICSKPLTMTYTGNVSINRWKTLKKIGEALLEINKNGVKIVLFIYSGSQDEKITKQLTMENAMYFRGNITTDEMSKVIEESDILLHVESFIKEDMLRVKDSISTKISDNLASNRAFLAVGPRGIASIDYLYENNVAYIIDDESIIKNKIVNYFIDNSIDVNLIKNAKKLAEKNHDIRVNSKQLRTIIDNVVKENSI